MNIIRYEVVSNDFTREFWINPSQDEETARLRAEDWYERLADTGPVSMYAIGSKPEEYRLLQRNDLQIKTQQEMVAEIDDAFQEAFDFDMWWKKQLDEEVER